MTKKVYTTDLGMVQAEIHRIAALLVMVSENLLDALPAKTSDKILLIAEAALEGWEVAVSAVIGELQRIEDEIEATMEKENAV